jgi:hypothetical protein
MSLSMHSRCATVVGMDMRTALEHLTAPGCVYENHAQAHDVHGTLIVAQRWSSPDWERDEAWLRLGGPGVQVNDAVHDLLERVSNTYDDIIHGDSVREHVRLGVAYDGYGARIVAGRWAAHPQDVLGIISNDQYAQVDNDVLDVVESVRVMYEEIRA